MVAHRTPGAGSFAAACAESTANGIGPVAGRRLVRVLDLIDNDRLMAEYRRLHAPGAVWPEVIAHIRDTGVLDMEIWCTGNRLVMIMTVIESFPRDVPVPASVAAWERLMDTFQRRLPGTPAGVKWRAMTSVFALEGAGEPS